MNPAFAPTVRGGAAALGLLFALLFQPAFTGHANSPCVVLGEHSADPATATQLEGLHCITGFSADAELQASWSFTAGDLNNRLATVSLSAAAGQRVQLDVLVPGADDAIATLTAANGRSEEAVWILLPADYLLRFQVSGEEGRFVFAADSPGDRWSVSRTPTGASGRDGRVNGAFQQLGSLDGGADTLRWTVSEDAGESLLWRLEFGGTAGFPLTLKLYDSEGSELMHHAVAAGAAMDLMDIELPAGENTFVLGPAGQTPQAGYFLRVSQLGPVTDGRKQGRTGSLTAAARIDLASGVSGSLLEDQTDYYHLQVTEAEAGFHELRLAADDDINSLCMEVAGGIELFCSAVEGELVVPLLRLDEGEYWFEINGRRNDEPAYSLSFTEVPAPEDDSIVFAPAGARANAFPLAEAGGARITHGGRTTTWLEFDVAESGLYRVQVQGAGELRQLRVTDGGGANIRSERQPRMDNIPLRTGTNYIALDAEAGQYALRVLRLGDLPPAQEPQPAAPAAEAAATGSLPQELEQLDIAARPEGTIVPGTNHHSNRAVRLDAGRDYTATIDGPDAHYRFTLLADTQVRLTLTPPEDGDMRLRLQPAAVENHTGDVPGEPVVAHQWLSAGDYSVQIRRNNDSHGWYTLRLDILDPLNLPLGLSPANAPNSQPLPANLKLAVPGNREDMSFLLPVTEVDTTLQVDIMDGSFRDVRILPYPDTRAGQRLSHLEADEEAGIFTTLLEGDVQYHLMLMSGAAEAWDLEFAFADGVEPVALPDPREHLELELELEAMRVAAWSRLGQSVEATLTVSNVSDEDVQFDLQTHASDPRASLAGLPAGLSLAAGDTVELPFRLSLPDDLRSDRPFTLTVGLSNEEGQTATATEDLLAICDAPHVLPGYWTPEPFASLSYWNHALAAFGTTITGEPVQENHDSRLIDGRVSVSRPRTFATGKEFRLDLNRDVTVQAVALHPIGGGSANERLRDFEIALSADGENWETVLTASLSGAAIEQVFEIPEPQTARHARLTVLNSQDRNSNISVGEFKLLGFDAPLERVNLADPQLGGHVVRANVWTGMSGPLEGPASGPGEGRPHVSVDGETGPLEMVLGFHENRAAMIESLQWQDYELRTNNHVYVPAVAVYVSTESPLGPWEHLTDWQLDRSDSPAEGAPAELSLDLAEPVWARFVRLVEITEDGTERRNLNLPSPLRVFERTHDDEYRSILSEWGMDRQVSGFEHSHPELVELATAEFAENMAAESARVLTDESSGFVQTGNFVAWYEFTVPEDANQLSLDIVSGASVALEYELFDAEGQTVAAGHSGDNLSLTVEPGTYRLSIAEPPRSIAFVWDNSGSVSSFAAMTYAALDEFAAGIRPDFEEVMLAVFASGGANFLLPDWSGSAEEVMRTLNAYDRSDGSSDAGAALISVNRQLQERRGSRAILLITDAAFGFSNTPAVWQGIEAAGTQIFTMHVSSDSTADAQDYMQDLADAREGHFAASPTYADLESGFARADCHIRRPKPYGVSVSFEQRVAQPGQLSVSLPAEGEASAGGMSAAGTGAIQVILDASGSMWQTLDGRFRYQIANDVLADLVSEVLPEDVPFALRVFGNREADVCRTDLEVALAPLEAGAVAAVIAGIEPQPFAGTPLAESILLAQQDLAGASGPRTLILITDGEESCDGDVEGAITELRSAGFDVVLNVIGFDFDAEDVEAARERFRSWAELGGGQYFDATDAAELADALERSVAPPFEVVDETGAVIARGTVGGSPVDVDGGTYTVRILSEPGQLLENVLIDGELLEVELNHSVNGDM